MFPQEGRFPTNRRFLIWGFLKCNQRPVIGEVEFIAGTEMLAWGRRCHHWFGVLCRKKNFKFQNYSRRVVGQVFMFCLQLEDWYLCLVMQLSKSIDTTHVPFLLSVNSLMPAALSFSFFPFSFLLFVLFWDNKAVAWLIPKLMPLTNIDESRTGYVCDP